MGTQTFGKGSVQTIIPVTSKGAIRLTTARYFTPSGTSIQAKGINPDIYVPQSKIEVLEKSNSRKEADLRGALDKEAKKKLMIMRLMGLLYQIIKKLRITNLIEPLI